MDIETRSNVPRSRPLLRVRDLSKHYVQRRPFSRAKYVVQAFEGVCLDIFPGMTLALVGESGAGKSSLARCLALLETPSSGEIQLAGCDPARSTRKERSAFHRRVQLIFQDPTTALNPRLTAREIIAEPLAIQEIGTKAQQRRRALELMDQVGLPTESEAKRPLEFSGGQRQRLAIARALTLRPDLLILDEALSNLDLVNQELILRLLAELQEAHSLTYLYISHDLRMVSGIADEIAVMHQGKIVEQKNAAELFSRPEQKYTQDLLAAAPSLESILADRLA